MLTVYTYELKLESHKPYDRELAKRLTDAVDNSLDLVAQCLNEQYPELKAQAIPQ
jgi:hypothetical protein